ncbi:MAG: hypothetical protein ACRDH2_19655, partial [Anaerolineales bacterium]
MSQAADLIPTLEAELLPETRRPSRWSERLRRYLPAIGLFLLALVVWEVVVTVFQIESFLLPKPSVIAAVFARELPVVFPAGLFTMREALGGFALGCTLGVVVALATARWT